MPSLLDRLAGTELDGAGMIRGYGPLEMMNSVRRDLENLFNTHNPATFVPQEYVEVHKSIVAYGMPDLPSLSSAAAFRREDILRVIEQVIADHEPRLRDVRVMLVDNASTAEQHRVRFHIEARLDVDPSPEVEFETVLELSTGQASVRPGVA